MAGFLAVRYGNWNIDAHLILKSLAVLQLLVAAVALATRGVHTDRVRVQICNFQYSSGINSWHSVRLREMTVLPSCCLSPLSVCSDISAYLSPSATLPNHFFVWTGPEHVLVQLQAQFSHQHTQHSGSLKVIKPSCFAVCRYQESLDHVLWHCML